MHNTLFLFKSQGDKKELDKFTKSCILKLYSFYYKGDIFMAKSKVANVITIILAALISVMLVVLAAVTPVYASLSALVKPENVVQVVNKVGKALVEAEVQENSGAAEEVSADSEFGTAVDNYMGKIQEFVSCQALVTGALSEFELNKSSVIALIDSNAVQEIVTVYAKDVCKYLLEGVAEHNLTEEKVKEILTDNFDEIFVIAKQSKTFTATEDVIKARLERAIEENSKEISEAVPTVEEITKVVNGNIILALRIFLNPIVTPILIGVCVLLAVLLCLCRLKKFGGFLWLGIDLSIAAVLLTVFYFLLANTPALIENSALYILVGAAVSIYLKILLTGMIILFAIAILAFALFFILKNKAAKKEAALAE